MCRDCDEYEKRKCTSHAGGKHVMSYSNVGIGKPMQLKTLGSSSLFVFPTEEEFLYQGWVHLHLQYML